MIETRRAARNLAKTALRELFEIGQRMGFDVLPRNFYSEIPDIRTLRTSDDWKRPYSMAGVAGVEIEQQLAFVEGQIPASVSDALRLRDIHVEASTANGERGYGRVEADFLYAFVATTRPKTIFQIGCGVSTAICLSAARDVGYRPSIVCIEPYPTVYLRRLAVEGAITLIEKKAQSLDLSTIDALGEDLLFFIDSTHTLGPAGEVSRLVLEALPRLKRGAFVHFHDITFPYDYPRDALDGALFFQHESVLLHAFLAYNERFTLRAAFSMLHYAAPERLALLFPDYKAARNSDGLAAGIGHFPSAAYIEVTG